MCGIAGFWSPTGLSRADVEALAAMTDTLVHRGPDAGGTWTQSEDGIALGHRRLSIIDLSPEGAQPMHSRDGRWTLVYNGEIYNHQVLRDALGSHPFRGHSDTESVVEHIAAFGVPATLAKTNGMFALAAWDREKKELWLARDRIGIKPLYFGRWQGKWLFGSELKTFTKFPGFCPALNRDAVTSLLRFNYIPAPDTIYSGIHKLPPGHLVRFSRDQMNAQPECWWSTVDAARRARANPFRGSGDTLIDELETLLMDAVKLRMAADVPLGAFLSGGLDSSTVVALMQAQSSRPVKTFSIGFHEAGFNEATYAKAVAEHLGTEHTELYVTPDEARDVIPLIPEFWDEPFSDSSQIPTYLVSKLARTEVTVSLSGDGGDELFGGYNRYVWAQRLWSAMRHVPSPLRAAVHGGVTRMPALTWRGLERGMSWAPQSVRIPQIESKVLKAAAMLRARTADEMYLALISHLRDPAAFVPGGRDQTENYLSRAHRHEFSDFLERMMLLDAGTYMVDDILTKVDRASMAVSLEARVPLLDHRVFEFAWSLPLDQRIKRGQTKWPIRQVLARHVPPALFERPKMGFGVPIGDWLRGSLRDWASELLDPRRMQQDGVFDSSRVGALWSAHVEGRPGEKYRLWNVLMFQAWLDANRQHVSI